jgi:hypothetical protein
VRFTGTGTSTGASTPFSYPQKIVKKETCSILSSIAAGKEDQITALFQNFQSSALAARLVKCAFDAPWDIRKEAVKAICNILTYGTDRHMECVVSVDGIKALCTVLQSKQDSSLLLLVMKALGGLLKAGKMHKRNYQVKMEEYGGADHLEALLEHPCTDVNETALILHHHFHEQDTQDDDDENLAPATEDATFAFGMPPKDLFSLGNRSSKVTFGGTSFNKISEA